jgi:uncharacterized membrane protein
LTEPKKASFLVKQNKRRFLKMDTRKLVRVAVLVALCGVGGFIKIPSPTGTVAFDSLPGYIAAVLLGGWGGAIVGALGHMFSAWTVSFKLGIVIHLYIAAQMALYVSIFGYLFNKGQKVLAIVVAVALNGILAPALLIPIYGIGFFYAMVLPLFVGSVVNIVLASVLVQSAAIRRAGSMVSAQNKHVS